MLKLQNGFLLVHFSILAIASLLSFHLAGTVRPMWVERDAVLCQWGVVVYLSNTQQ